MKEFLNGVRRAEKKRSAGGCVLISICFLLFGLAAGVAAKLFDLYTQNLGSVFSQMSVWIFIGTLIAIHSASPGRAGIFVFLFCAGMIASYYRTAELTHSIYAARYIWGWSFFTLFSPLFAYVAWYAAGNGWFAAAVTAGILAAILLLANILFTGVGPADIVLAIMTALAVFLKKRKLKKMRACADET